MQFCLVKIYSYHNRKWKRFKNEWVFVEINKTFLEDIIIKYILIKHHQKTSHYKSIFLYMYTRLGTLTSAQINLFLHNFIIRLNSVYGADSRLPLRRNCFAKKIIRYKPSKS